ncbi:response regulator transcription factor [Compostimonas suwonensis]|uniref:DNA-binding response OmpR family regulator n=1 Tax=Compostimonas suwonensis TaxID=1048394 RepID=A0A2M9BCD2_9MICO|nr:response regulator transcription factor [Compostimonas suwonensis]PJJ55618.1 DNA-binding response OmpR family regulator [Compostimonas suwonensis]
MDTTPTPRMAVVIEDDIDIRHLLETVLSQAGFQTVATGNGVDGVQAVTSYNPLVTTLDVSMPGIDGYETARRIRSFSSTYIVMISARGEEIDILQGLEAGADDYIIKPFRPRELRARIEAMLRRPRMPLADEPANDAAAPAGVAAATAPAIAAAPASDPDTATTRTLPDDFEHEDEWLVHNGLRANAATRLAAVDTTEIELTRSEFDLLVALLESRRRVRSKADLALLLRGESYITNHYISESDKRAVEVHMGNLRRKLGESSTNPRWIETVRGIGYRLTAPEDH